MDIIGNAIRNIGDDSFKVRRIPRGEWVSEDDREGMRDEMKSRIRANDAYRARSAMRARDIFSD